MMNLLVNHQEVDSCYVKVSQIHLLDVVKMESIKLSKKYNLNVVIEHAHSCSIWQDNIDVSNKKIPAPRSSNLDSK